MKTLQRESFALASALVATAIIATFVALTVPGPHAPAGARQSLAATAATNTAPQLAATQSATHPAPKAKLPAALGSAARVRTHRLVLVAASLSTPAT